MQKNDDRRRPGRPPVEPERPTPEWREQRRKEGRVPMTKSEIRDIVRRVVRKQCDPMVRRVCRLFMAGFGHEDVCRLTKIRMGTLERILNGLARDFLEAGVHLRKQVPHA